MTNPNNPQQPAGQPQSPFRPQQATGKAKKPIFKDHRFWIGCATGVVLAVCVIFGAALISTSTGRNQTADISSSNTLINLKQINADCSSVTKNGEDSALAIPEDSGKTLSLHQPSLTTNKLFLCIAEGSKMPSSIQEKINMSQHDSSTQTDKWENITITWNWDPNGTLVAVLQEN